MKLNKLEEPAEVAGRHNYSVTRWTKTLSLSQFLFGNPLRVCTRGLKIDDFLKPATWRQFPITRWRKCTRKKGNPWSSASH